MGQRDTCFTNRAGSDNLWSVFFLISFKWLGYCEFSLSWNSNLFELGYLNIQRVWWYLRNLFASFVAHWHDSDIICYNMPYINNIRTLFLIFTLYQYFLSGTKLSFSFNKFDKFIQNLNILHQKTWKEMSEVSTSV